MPDIWEVVAHSAQRTFERAHCSRAVYNVLPLDIFLSITSISNILYRSTICFMYIFCNVLCMIVVILVILHLRV